MPFTRGPWRNHDFHHAKRPKNQPNPRCAHAEPSSLWTSPRVELAAQLSPRCWDDHPIEDWKHSIGWGLKRYGDGILKKTFHAQKKEPSIHLSQSFQLRLALSICICIYIYIYSIHIYMVGGWALPLWKIWLRHLGLWNSQYVESHNPFMFQSTNQNSINLHCCWWNHHFPMVFLWFSYMKMSRKPYPCCSPK